MSWQWHEKPNERGAYVASWDRPIIGVDTYSGDTRVLEGHIPFTQNMYVEAGRPTGVAGYSLYDTTMTAADGATPLGFGQYISGSTEQFIIIQANGTAQRWNAAGNAWVNLMQGLPTSNNQYNPLNYSTYLIWANPSGNWKWNGENFLPLGARIVTDCESDQDGQWADETVETTTIREGLQSYKRTVGAGGTATMVFTPTTNLNLTTGLQGAPSYSETNAGLGFFLRVTSAAAVNEASSFLEIATSAGNERQMNFNNANFRAYDGTVITFADNTWFHIFIRLEDMTETGAFNLADVDTLTISMTSDGAAYDYFVDCFYINYEAVSRMPGVQSMAVWNDVLLGAGATTATGTDYVSAGDPSDLLFADVGSPDEFDATAFISVNPDAGGPIRALKRFFNQVFIGKENSIHSLGGTTAGTVYPNFNFEIIDITGEHGCDGHRSITEMERKLYFPWKRRYYTYDGTGTSEIGERITPDLADHSVTRLTQKTSALYDGDIWLAYPGNGDTHNARLFKFTSFGGREGFVGVEDDAAALNLNLLLQVFDAGAERLIGIDQAGNILNLDDTAATTFNGTAIVRITRFPWLARTGDDLTMWGNVYIPFDTQSSGTISIRYRIADHPRAMTAATFVESTTLALSSDDTFGWAQIFEISRWIQLEVRSSAAIYDLQFPITIEATPMGYQA